MEGCERCVVRIKPESLTGREITYLIIINNYHNNNNNNKVINIVFFYVLTAESNGCLQKQHKYKETTNKTKTRAQTKENKNAMC
jgi:hypothetical protein